jgi:hypothetical protein
MRYKFLLTLIFFFSLAIAGNAPSNVQTEFDRLFPGIQDVIWERESPKGWNAEFTLNEKNVKASFSFAGAWIETIYEINLEELPIQIKESVNSFYPEWQIVVASKINNSKGEELYKTAIQQNGKLQELVMKPEGTLMMVVTK